MTEEEPRSEPRFYFSFNREVRRVPLGWEHSRDEKGDIIPLYDHSHFDDELVEEYLTKGPEYTREVVESLHMPDFSGIPEEQMGICAYETTTEGTPISPIFPNTPQGRFELAKYCTENSSIFANQKTGIEAWLGILFGRGYAMLNATEGTIEIREPLPPDIPPIR